METPFTVDIITTYDPIHQKHRVVGDLDAVKADAKKYIDGIASYFAARAEDLESLESVDHVSRLLKDIMGVLNSIAWAPHYETRTVDLSAVPEVTR